MWWFVGIICLLQATGGSKELTRRKRDVNPEVYMNVSEVIGYRGYPSKEYEVLTEDGYYLTINRIPSGRYNLAVRDPKPVVFLQHGLFGEASHWVENMAKNSLGFILADVGYDVWLGNNRGTSWSQRHQNLSADQEDYWNFSFHEMAMYDLPAMINFILKKTGQKQLYYIGYSQGSTIGLIAFSAMPELSQKIKMFFALAPVITIKHSRSNILKLLSYPDFPPKSLDAAWNQYCCMPCSLKENDVNSDHKATLGSGEFVISSKLIKDFLFKLCSIRSMQQLCGHLIFAPGGFNATNLNMSRIDVYATRYPDGTSVKNILHWKQTKSGLFRYFDYDNENEVKYNQSFPPSYKIEDMVVPTAMWSGGNDLIADRENMKNLLPRITNLVYHQNLSEWNHWDFIWGLSAPKYVYLKIIELMGKHL